MPLFGAIPGVQRVPELVLRPFALFSVSVPSLAPANNGINLALEWPPRWLEGGLGGEERGEKVEENSQG